MVAKNLPLPNVRKMFVPDYGHTIVDADLAGADAQVVAWEAGDEDLKTAFRSGVKIHIHNARAIWPHETKDMDNGELKESRYYKQAKSGCHATNYGGRPPALVTNLGWSLTFAEEFQYRWFHLHPSIRKWHEHIQGCLDGTICWNCETTDTILGKPCQACGVMLGRTVKNVFGFRRKFYERVDGRLLPEALAWAPQSTVAFCIDLGWTSIAYGTEYISKLGRFTWRDWLVEPRAKEKWGDKMQFLLQVHDSVVFQTPTRYEADIPEMVSDMRVKCPYDDPLIIPLSYGMSRVSWGDCKE